MNCGKKHRRNIGLQARSSPCAKLAHHTASHTWRINFNALNLSVDSLSVPFKELRVSAPLHVRPFKWRVLHSPLQRHYNLSADPPTGLLYEEFKDIFRKEPESKTQESNQSNHVSLEHPFPCIKAPLGEVPTALGTRTPSCYTNSSSMMRVIFLITEAGR